MHVSIIPAESYIVEKYAVFIINSNCVYDVRKSLALLAKWLPSVDQISSCA